MRHQQRDLLIISPTEAVTCKVKWKLRLSSPLSLKQRGGKVIYVFHFSSRSRDKGEPRSESDEDEKIPFPHL